MVQDSPRQCMVIATKGCAGPAEALVINLYIIIIDRSKDPAAGTRGHGTDSNIMCRISSPFLLPYENASLDEEPVHPVLGCTAGNTGSMLDIGNSKKTFIKSELPHKAQVLTAALKNGGHNGL